MIKSDETSWARTKTVSSIDKSKGDKWKADKIANLKQKEGYKRMEDLLTEVTDC